MAGIDRNDDLEGGKPSARERVDEAASSMKTTAKETARKVKRAAGDAYEDASETVRDYAEQARSQASDMASALADTAGSIARDAIESRKVAGAAEVGGIASAVRRVADDMQHQSPHTARYVRQAAASIDGVSQNLRDKSVSEIVDEVARYAGRQPVTFFAGAVIAGIALSRFFKSAPGERPAQRLLPRPAHPRQDEAQRSFEERVDEAERRRRAEGRTHGAI